MKRPSIARLGQRQREPERRALARRADYAYLPEVPLDDVLVDVQTQAQTHTRSTLDGDVRGFVEALPDPLLAGLRNADAAAVDVYPCAVALHLQSHLDGLMLFGVFERVRQVVGDYLPDAQGVGDDGRGLCSRQLQANDSTGPQH